MTTTTKKAKLTVTFEGVTVTRSTARTYTHVVLAKGERAEVLEAERLRAIAFSRKESAEYAEALRTGTLKGYEHAVAGWIADGSLAKWATDHAARVATLEAQGPITADGGDEWGVVGWCGRLDLAGKLAAQQDRYRHVAIVDVATGQRVR